MMGVTVEVVVAFTRILLCKSAWNGTRTLTKGERAPREEAKQEEGERREVLWKLQLRVSRKSQDLFTFVATWFC